MRQRVIIAETDVHILIFDLFLYIICFPGRKKVRVVSGDQDGGERRYRGADRLHPARGQRPSTGATS
jgi:hypothetical protein